MRNNYKMNYIAAGVRNNWYCLNIIPQSEIWPLNIRNAFSFLIFWSIHQTEIYLIFMHLCCSLLEMSPPPLFFSTSWYWHINPKRADLNRLNSTFQWKKRVGGSYLSVWWSGRKFHFTGFWCALLSWHPDPILTQELVHTCGSMCKCVH